MQTAPPPIPTTKPTDYAEAGEVITMSERIMENLPYLIMITVLVLTLFFSTLKWVCLTRQLQETLVQILLLHKDRYLPTQLYRAIYRQLHLPLKYIETQGMGNHWQMIEMLESQGIAKLEMLRLKQLAGRLSYALRLAFASIIKTRRH